MAAKTQHWDYVLAKAYMQGVPEAQRDALARAYRALPSVADDTRRYAQRIIEGRTHLDIPHYRTMGLVETRDVTALAQMVTPDGVPLDVAGFDWSLDAPSVRHTHNRHGAGNEKDTSQRGVTPSDFARLPQIIAAPDNMNISPRLSGGNRYPVVELRKEIDGETFVARFEVRAAKRRTLTLLSIFVKKKG